MSEYRTIHSASGTCHFRALGVNIQVGQAGFRRATLLQEATLMPINQCYLGRQVIRPPYLFRFLCAVLLIGLPKMGTAQQFGGSPPWGREKPTHFSGEIRRGETFTQPIGDGLSFSVTEEWEIRVGRLGNDYSDCATEPFHGPNAKDLMAWHFQGGTLGPGGIGQKRWINFTPNDEDNRVQCEQVEAALQGKDTFENRITGRCWFTPLSVKLSNDPPDRQSIDEMKFEGECALHGALELWRLPVTYTISSGFTGWATICFGARGVPELPRTGDRYHLVIGKEPTLHTSSDLRQDSRGARFELRNGTAIAADGPHQMIWGWMNGYASCGPFQSFFVGTASQYRSQASNPLLR